MAVKQEFTFLSGDGKTDVHAVRWMPDNGDYRAVFQISHGMIEFIERYEPFAAFLADKGYKVVGHDHLGHGKTAKTPEDWGYFADGESPEILIGDMNKLRTLSQEPDKPYFMLGHSMGSYLLRRYLSVYGEGLSGAVIMGTGANPDAVAKLGMAVCKTIAAFKGWKYRSPFMEKLFFSGDFQKFDMDGTHPENSWLTKDTEIVRFYYSEPRCTFKFTLKAYYDFLKTVYYVNRKENVEKIPKDLPILMVAGDCDPVGEFGKAVKRVYEMYKAAGINDVTLKLYENDRHEILNETDKERVFDDIFNWCESRQ